MKHFWLKWMAIIIWFAVIVQFFLLLENRTTTLPLTMLRFFSFFTILTNTLAAIYFTVLAWGQKNNPFYRFFFRPGSLTALTVYILVVGLVYQLVLRGIWDPKGLQWLVDELLHSFNPLMVFAFWIYAENKKGLQWQMLPYWLVYPAVYLVVILLLGEMTDFYPYPFVNVALLGLSEVLLNSLYVLCLILCLAAGLLFAGKTFPKK